MGCRLTASVIVLSVVWAAWGEAGSPARQLYRSTDAHGNVIYSDRPGSGDLSTPADRAVDAALVDELFRAAGVDRRLPDLAAQIQAEFRRQSGLGATPERQTLSDIVARQFNTDTLYAMVRDEFLRAAAGGPTRNTLAWYRSPFGRRVVGLEIQAGAPESQREFRAYATSIGGHWPASRVVLVRRLDDATRANETGLDSLVVMLRSFAVAVDAARAPDQRMDRAQLESQLKQTRDRAFGPTRQGALVAMLFTYRNLGEPDLERYARFMESEAGGWYTRTLNRSLIRAVGIIAERTGSEVVRALPPERWQGQRASGAPR